MNSTIAKSVRSWGLLLCCLLLLTAAHAQSVPTQTVEKGDVAAADASPPESGSAEAAREAGSDEDDKRDAAADHDADKDDQVERHHPAQKDRAVDEDRDESHDDENGDDDDVPFTFSNSDTDHPSRHRNRSHRRHVASDVVSIGRKAELRAGEHSNSVVAIFGSAISAGDVDEAVVSVLGHTHVTGRVGDSAVAVMGSVYVNSEVDGDVVAVMGNVELGPEAKVHGDVVVVGGKVIRDASATVDGHVQDVVGVEWEHVNWLRPWFERCLLYGRPLALVPGVGWAWGIALALLALYAFLAFAFRGAVDRCVHTLETQPGHSILAALVLMLAVPVLTVLLIITVLGIAVLPFLAVAMLCAATFGKVAVLATIGRRCTPMLAHDPVRHTVVGVVVGGLIAMAIYIIPVVGLLVYKLLGLLGLGVVAYTLLLGVRARRQARMVGGGGGGGSGPEGGAGPPGFAGPGGGAGPAGASVPGGAEPSAATSGPAEELHATGATQGADAAAAAGGGFASSTGRSSGNPPLGGTMNYTSGAARAAPIDVTTARRAGFGVRMGALVIDIVLVTIALHMLNDPDNAELFVLAAYAAVMWKLRGATIGGIICGLQVVRLDGRPIDWPTAIVRALGCFLSLAVVFLGFIWIAIDRDKQSWHDKIAGTVVVRAPKGVSLL